MGAVPLGKLAWTTFHTSLLTGALSLVSLLEQMGFNLGSRKQIDLGQQSTVCVIRLSIADPDHSVTTGELPFSTGQLPVKA